MEDPHGGGPAPGRTRTGDDPHWEDPHREASRGPECRDVHYSPRAPPAEWTQAQRPPAQPAMLTLVRGHRLQGLLQQLPLVQPESHEQRPGEVPLAQGRTDPPRGDAGVQLEGVEEQLGIQGVDEEALGAGGRPAASCEVKSSGSSVLLTYPLIQRTHSQGP